MGRIGIVLLVAAFVVYVAREMGAAAALHPPAADGPRHRRRAARACSTAGEPTTVIDVRSKLSQSVTGRIPGAITVDVTNMRVDLLAIEPTNEVVVYCACPNEAYGREGRAGADPAWIPARAAARRRHRRVDRSGPRGRALMQRRTARADLLESTLAGWTRHMTENRQPRTRRRRSAPIRRRSAPATPSTCPARSASIPRRGSSSTARRRRRIACSPNLRAVARGGGRRARRHREGHAPPRRPGATSRRSTRSWRRISRRPIRRARPTRWRRCRAGPRRGRWRPRACEIALGATRA